MRRDDIKALLTQLIPANSVMCPPMCIRRQRYDVFNYIWTAFRKWNNVMSFKINTTIRHFESR
ncbi:hypothetical protein BKM30_13095 [Pseudomonas syringae pv. syringae]|nr:hypothetical protein BKM27_13710 [Pseudomonas syringae pv. syringae]POR78429.1 hypothetical protein BKM30_13095 [Pseudomonas syringae pv. syringae]